MLRPVVVSAMGVFAFFGLMTWELLLYVLVVAGSLGGLASMAISIHALNIAKDVQDKQARRITALDEPGE